MEATTMEECKLVDKGYKGVQAYSAVGALYKLQDKVPAVSQ